MRYRVDIDYQLVIGLWGYSLNPTLKDKDTIWIYKQFWHSFSLSIK